MDTLPPQTMDCLEELAKGVAEMVSEKCEGMTQREAASYCHNMGLNEEDQEDYGKAAQWHAFGLMLKLEMSSGGDSFLVNKALHKTGDVLMKAGDPRTGLELCTAAEKMLLRLEPQNTSALQMILESIAKCHHALGNTREAVNVEVEVVLNDRYGIQEDTALDLLRSGQFQDDPVRALAFARAAQKAGPEDTVEAVDVMVFTAYCEDRLGFDSEAADLLRKAEVAADAADPQQRGAALRSVAQGLESTRRNERAMIMHRKAHEADSSDLVYYARACTRLGLKDQVEPLFAAALAAAPNAAERSDVLLAQGIWRTEVGAECAVEVLTEACSIRKHEHRAIGSDESKKRYAQALVECSIACEAANQPREAKRLCEKRLELYGVKKEKRGLRGVFFRKFKK
eukprot:Sspe_Gene.36361::Locus_17573_Transcript_2_6_Confidence_0.333_Length_2496::g.36361::m.36361